MEGPSPAPPLTGMCLSTGGRGGGDLADPPPPEAKPKNGSSGENEILNRAKNERPISGTQTCFCPHNPPPTPPFPSCSRTPSTPLPPRLRPEGCIGGEGVSDRVVQSGLGGSWRGLPNGFGAVTAGKNCHFGDGGAAAAPQVRTAYETIATAQEQGNAAGGTALGPLPGHMKCGDGGRNLMAEREHSRTQNPVPHTRRGSPRVRVLLGALRSPAPPPPPPPHHLHRPAPDAAGATLTRGAGTEGTGPGSPRSPSALGRPGGSGRWCCGGRGRGGRRGRTRRTGGGGRPGCGPTSQSCGPARRCTARRAPGGPGGT